MILAKLIHGTLEFAPSTLATDGFKVVNPPAELLRARGYKEVVYPTPASEETADGFEPTAAPTPVREVYTETENHILVAFEPLEESAPDPATLREEAYRAEADQHLIAHQGYLLEGKTAEAEAQKAAYLAKKTEIRGRITQNQ